MYFICHQTVKLELDHEKKIEVETLQSEFNIQLEIELKKQVSELALQTTEHTSSLPSQLDGHSREDEASSEHNLMQTVAFEPQQFLQVRIIYVDI